MIHFGQHFINPMANNPTKHHYMSVRMTDDMHKNFSRKSREVATPSIVLRELISAFIAERILVNPKTKTIEDILNVNRK